MNASSLLSWEGSLYDFDIHLTFEDAAEGVSIFTDTRSVVFVDHDRRLTSKWNRARVTETYKMHVTQSERTSISLIFIFLKLSISLFTITFLSRVILRFLFGTTMIVTNTKSCYMH